jgi:hypothetical protein
MFSEDLMMYGLKRRHQPEKTRHDYHYGQPLHNIIGFEPTDYESKIAPDFPAHDESDGKSEKFIAIRILGCMIPVDCENSNVEEIYEQLKTCYLCSL